MAISAPTLPTTPQRTKAAGARNRTRSSNASARSIEAMGRHHTAPRQNTDSAKNSPDLARPGLCNSHYYGQSVIPRKSCVIAEEYELVTFDEEAAENTKT
jgi:hypothetical protein